MNGHIKIIIDADEVLRWADKRKTTKERCALLIGHKDESTEEGHWGALVYTVIGIIEVPNRHKDGENHFEIGKKAAYAALEKHGYSEGDLIGSMHTHLRGGPDPSYNDCRSIPDGVLGIVVHPRSRTVTYYNRQGFINKETRQ